MGSWPCVWVFTLFSNVPQPFAPSLVLMEVSAPDQTSASAPQAGEGSIATWVSRMVPPPTTHTATAHTHTYTHTWAMGVGAGTEIALPWHPAPFSSLLFLVTRC